MIACGAAAAQAGVLEGLRGGLGLNAAAARAAEAAARQRAGRREEDCATLDQDVGALCRGALAHAELWGWVAGLAEALAARLEILGGTGEAPLPDLPDGGLGGAARIRALAWAKEGAASRDAGHVPN